MVRRNLQHARVLITGASSGIGWQLARELGRSQARLLLTARRASRLAELAEQLQAQGAEATYVAGDITDPDLRRQLAGAVHERWGGLDVLINNAGLGAVGPFREASPERLRRVMEVNFFAVAELTRELLPLLDRGRDPLVVNLGSVLGHCAVPDKSEYCASKFALRGWTDAIRAELLGQGIGVLLVSPSTTASEFFEHVIDSPPTVRRRRLQMSPQRVARIAVRAMERRQREVVLSLSGKALVWGNRLAPGVVARVVRRARAQRL